ncbi:MAG: carbonic anhydrase [Saprospiraceae bacterium]|jgi:carbonic anhydrase|nr:carbonic anhydrase [Saprospiraceae bacterium]
MRTHTKETQQELTPQLAFEILKQGNERFVSNLHYNRNLLQQVNDTSGGQFPFAIVLSCIDSRTSAELIFDQGLGDIFSARIAGNVLNEDILGSMEFACNVAGSKLIVVLGHSKCGAVKGACSHVEMGHLTALLEKIQPAVERIDSKNLQISFDEKVEEVASENVKLQMKDIFRRSSILRNLFKEGKIGLVGGMYSVESGVVEFFEPKFHEIGQDEIQVEEELTI